MQNRRTFLGASAAVLASAYVAAGAEPVDAKAAYRAAIIGHTGRGNYGHEVDVLFNDRTDCTVVAIADADEKGRATAAERSRAAKQYADYREMLTTEKPQLVAIAPRHTDQHVAMAVAAFDIGAHVFMEKPIAASPADADTILAAADRAKRTIVIAHQMRMAPSIVKLKEAIGNGLIGDLLQIDAWGKQDGRAGGEDMIVLGTHLLDLMRHFAGGDPQWCTARVLQRGKEITKADARTVAEAIGPVAGDEISAQFAFPAGVNGTFTSRGRLREMIGPWGLELIGSKGAVRILTEVEPNVLVLRAGKWSPTGRSDEWKPLEGAPAGSTNFPVANRRVVDDWLDAIRHNREPVCNGKNAANAVEMVTAVYHAALKGSRVNLPLADRAHPLS